jgi:hypothetical protein
MRTQISRSIPLGQGTGYLRDFITGTRTFDEARTRKVRMFYSHTILDHWTPHFTLLNPYSGPNADGLASPRMNSMNEPIDA